MALQGNPAGLPELAFTHAGRFHADDVFSAALLRLLRPDIRIYRGYEVPKGFSGLVFDIGDGPFDHHARERERRPGGAPYAAFGLLWRVYGEYFLPPEKAQWFDDKFVQPLDIDDNNGTGNLLATLIGTFNPAWDSDEDEDANFEEAVEVAGKLLERRIESIAALARGEKVVEKALGGMKDGVVVLDTYVPWKPILIPSEAEFVVFPSARGGYSLQCMPRDIGGKLGNKVPLPASWRGRTPAELQEITGVDGITFCHASGFMAAVASVEEAFVLVKIAREQEKRRLEQSQRDRQAAIAAGRVPAKTTEAARPTTAPVTDIGEI